MGKDAGSDILCGGDLQQHMALSSADLLTAGPAMIGNDPLKLTQVMTETPYRDDIDFQRDEPPFELLVSYNDCKLQQLSTRACPVRPDSEARGSTVEARAALVVA